MQVGIGDYLSIFPQMFVYWFWDGPKALMDYFASLNSATLKLLSLRLLVSTFFKPWKNEYREGLVGFSIGMGVVIKTFVILFDLAVLLFLLCAEFVLLFLFLSWPVVTVLMIVR